MNKFRIASACISAAMIGSFATAQTASPKDVVTAFFNLAFVQGKPAEAAERYISGEKFVQHNPGVADGREAFVKELPAFLRATGYRASIKRVFTDGDFVIVHSNTRNPAKAEDRGLAIVDIFRVRSGKIVEHWDVIQSVPASAANANTMF